MKKILLAALTLVLVLSSILLQAQTKKGQTIFSGQFGGKYVQSQAYLVKSPQQLYNANIEAGYFLRDGLAVGLRLDGSFNNSRLNLEYAPELLSRNRSYSAGITPFLRKYWKLSSFYLYAGGGAKMAFRGNRDEYKPITGFDSEDSRVHQFDFDTRAQLGLIYPITNRLGLEFGAESVLFPLSFNTLHIGLVLFNVGSSGESKKVITDSPLSKGRWLLSGSVQSQYNETTKTKNLNNIEKSSNRGTYLDLSGGFFLRDRLMLGIGVFAGLNDGVLSRERLGSAGTDKTPFMIGLRPFVKNYWSATKLTPYLEGYGTFASTKSGGAPTYTYSIGANLGLAYSLSKKWLVEARLLQISGGNSWLTNTEPGLESSRFNIALEGGLKPNFTISYVFP